MSSSISIFNGLGSAVLIATAEDDSLIQSILNPLKVFNVSSYGARGGATFDQTVQIQACIDAASAYTAADPDAHAVIAFPPFVYGVKSLTVDGARLTFHAYGATLWGLAGSGFNQTLYLKGEPFGGVAEDNTFYGLTIDGNYPTNVPTGAGHGINCSAHKQTFIDCIVRRVKGDGFLNQFNIDAKYVRCKAQKTYGHSYRFRGDSAEMLGCEAHDWNEGDVTNTRAIQFDSNEMDAESFRVKGFYARQSVARTNAAGILVDCGDGELDGGNDIPCSNASNVRGKAAWTVRAGHGFAPGDPFRISESGVVSYDGHATASYGKYHKITRITGGGVFVYVVDANTIQLYKNSSDAINNGGTSTNRWVLSDTGSGVMYIKSEGGRRRAFTVSDQATCTLTCTGHGFTTGKPARLSVAVGASDALPAPLETGNVIETNTPYVSAGTTTFTRKPKRVKYVELDDVTVVQAWADGQNDSAVKINNTNNLRINRLRVNPGATKTGWENQSLRIGPSNRKVIVSDCVLPNGIIINTRGVVADLTVCNSEIGGEDVFPDIAFKDVQAYKFHCYGNVLRAGTAIFTTPSVDSEFIDNDVDDLHVHDNIFEGKGSGICTIFDPGDISHMRRSNIIRYYNNIRRHVGADFPGLVFTAATNDVCVTAIANHCFRTGDEVQVYSTGTLPAATPSLTNTTFFVRRHTSGNDAFTLHTNLPGTSDNTNRVDITDTGSGTHYIVGKNNVGMPFTDSGIRDLFYFQRGTEGRQFEAIAVPSNSLIRHTQGDIVWNMHAAADGSPGWFCVKTGVAGTTAATFDALPVMT